MLFTSPVFLFLFLPIVLCINFVIKDELRNGWLCLASLLFYFWDENTYALIMIMSISINYVSAIGIFYVRTNMTESRARWVLAAAVSSNLMLLMFFKYTSFLVEIVNIVTLQRIKPMEQAPSVHLPLGISFFTFHGLSYIIDVYRKEVEVEWNPVTLGLYFSFFPQLIAGPIVRYHDVAQQLIEKRQFKRNEFAQGAVRFVFGLSKKMLVANTVAVLADAIFALPLEKLDASHAWLGLLAYTIQIYFDFSGYSDMAIGLALLFGVQFRENFKYPYVSRSLREFWRRWHISLSNWFRDYLYISLGGNRVSERRIYFNLLTVFFLCGLWHGASWSFVIWGLYHGTFLVLERTTIFSSALTKIPRVLQHLYALTIVSFGWVFFRATTLNHAIEFIQTLLGLQFRHNRPNIPVKQYLDTKVSLVIVIAIFGSSGLLSSFLRALKHMPGCFAAKHARMLANSILYFLWIVTFVCLFSLSIIAISSGLYNPFIYFRFWEIRTAHFLIMISNIQRQRMLFDWLITTIFLLFLTLPEINRQLLVFPDVPSTEKRTLAPYPLLNIRKISDFMKNFDLFYNDHFGFRLRLVGANTLLHVKLFGISGVKQVIIGKHGWLYYTEYGLTDPKGFSGWQGYDPLSLDQLIAIQNNLEAELRWFVNHNITYFILPAPDKNSIYPEYLPWRFSTIIGPSRQAQIFEHMKSHSKLELIDVRQALLNAKKSYSLDTYFKTDSHWNNFGAFLAYVEVMKRLLARYPGLVPHRLKEFVPDRKLKWEGDLTRMANLDVSHMLEHQLVPNQNMTSNNTGLKEGKILIFGDSFSHFFFKDYFQRHFNEVQLIRGDRSSRSQMDKQIILNHRPDVVIFESIERHWTRVWRIPPNVEDSRFHDSSSVTLISLLVHLTHLYFFFQTTHCEKLSQHARKCLVWRANDTHEPQITVKLQSVQQFKVWSGKDNEFVGLIICFHLIWVR